MANMPDDELISAYLDGELSGDERARAEQLLAAQPESRQLLEELTALRASLQALPRHSLEEGFADAVLRRAEREMLQPTTVTAAAPARALYDELRPPVISWKRWQRPLAWSALAIAAALLIMAFSPDEPKVAVAPAPPGGELNAARPPDEMVARAGPAPAAVANEEALPKMREAELGRPRQLNRFLAATDEQGKTADAFSPPSADRLLVVHCDVSAGADGEAALRQLLAEHKIAWEDAPSDKQSVVALARERVSDADDAERRPPGKRGAASPAVSPDAVYAIAPPEQVRAALASLNANDAFHNVTVNEVAAPVDASGMYFYSPPPDVAKPMPAAAPAVPSERKAPALRGLIPIDGRAVRLPLAEIPSKLGLPESSWDKILDSEVAGVAASDEDNKPAPAQQRQNFAAATGGQAGEPSLARVLFVFRVVPKPNSGD
jgi:negative regulator of sigma E activity